MSRSSILHNSLPYNAENRPIRFESEDGSTVVECTYDTQGRRATKKVTTNGEVTLHQRYIYRGYLQIACCDLQRSWQPALWYILWDPTQPVATRPLAIQKDATWYTYGWDLTKNICELYDPNGYIRTTYIYSPYGSVTPNGDVTQPIQWSSEFYDTELGLVYYNYRYYNPEEGRWCTRDLETMKNYDLYSLCRFMLNSPMYNVDFLGAAKLVKRLLDIPIAYECKTSDGKYIAFPMGPIDYKAGLKVEHSHFLFDDGSDIGYFDDGQVRADDDKIHTYFTVRSGLDDVILKQAIAQTPPRPYKLTPVKKFCLSKFRFIRDENYDNCHTWANRVLERYEILLKQQSQNPHL